VSNIIRVFYRILTHGFFIFVNINMVRKPDQRAVVKVSEFRIIHGSPVTDRKSIIQYPIVCERIEESGRLGQVKPHCQAPAFYASAVTVKIRAL